MGFSMRILRKKSTWNNPKVLLILNLHNCKANPSLFIYKNGDVRILLLAYVDDVTVVSSNANLIESLITQLDQEFALKHLGTLHYFLGLEVKYFLVIKSLVAAKVASLHDDQDAVNALNTVALWGLQYLTFTHPNITDALPEELFSRKSDDDNDNNASASSIFSMSLLSLVSGMGNFLVLLLPDHEGMADRSGVGLGWTFLVLLISGRNGSLIRFAKASF
ncbi:hypothetical protein AAG906_017685 [Vitis piasezkii]